MDIAIPKIWIWDIPLQKNCDLDIQYLVSFMIFNVVRPMIVLGISRHN